MEAIIKTNKYMSLDELMKKVDVVLQYAQYADKASIQNFILTLDEDERQNLASTLSEMEDLLTYSAE